MGGVIIMKDKYSKENESSNEDRFCELCRSSGLKVTPQRRLVYQIVLNSKAHPTAEMVYRLAREQMPSVSFDTINRTLLTFNEIGAAFIVEGSGEARRFDANFDKHQHFKCVKCKRIIDFHCDRFDNIGVPKKVLGGHKVLRKTVYFEGICEDCLKKQKMNNSQ